VRQFRAPAKINLSLKVLGRQPDGYHQLESLFAPLQLADGLIVARREQGGVSLSCPGSDLGADETNLAWRAGAAFIQAARPGWGLSITLFKEIPIAAGLGGGSSDAAAVLKAANDLAGRPFSGGELEELGLSLGADVPFFIQARPALVRGVGQILTPAALPPFHCLLINPGFEVSTAWVFSQLRKPLTSPVGLDTVTPLRVSSFKDLLDLGNDLEEVVEQTWPVVKRLRLSLLEAGAELARMSGSGPTVFGLFDRLDQAEKARRRIGEEEGWRVILTEAASSVGV